MISVPARRATFHTMPRSAYSDDLPPLYARWASEFLSGPIPAETEATCSNCAMLPADGGNAHTAAAAFFNPDTKCCTYLPVLPNFLVGRMLADDSGEFARGRATLEARLTTGVAVTPFGIGRSATFDLLYVTSATSWFGRARSMRCPHYIDEVGGQCGVWRHRAAVCATWFCKHRRGAVGHRFWQALHRLLSAVERELSLWCALELGVSSHAFRRFLNERKGAPSPGPADLDGVSDKEARAFGEWSGRESDYFRECGRLVDALRWHDVERICGSEVRALMTVTREAFDELRSSTIPRLLRAGSFKVIGHGQRSSIVEGYDGGDCIELPAEVLEVLHRFDGSMSTTQTLQRICTETGLTIERDLVRLLVDFEILIPAGRDE
jgi:hypothetical protein